MPLTKILDLSYEVHGETINLEQDAGTGEVHRIDLHPMHVSLLAAELGLMQGDADARRRVATLERRLRVLLDRIDRLDDLIYLASEKGREDLEVESALTYATWELATEFCHDLSPQAGAESHQAPASRSTEAAIPEVHKGSEAATPPVLPAETTRPLSALERSSLTKLVVGMAIDRYGYEPNDRRSTAIPEIGKAIRSLGLAIEDDTVRKYVREGSDQHIPKDWSRDQQLRVPLG